MDLLDLLLHPKKANRRYSPLIEGLTEGQANELRFVFNRVREGEHRAAIQGERTYASYDPVVRAAYAKDASGIPASLDSLIKRTPGAVVMPTNRGELLELLNFSEGNNVPITPRGGGTGLFGGAIPAEGGVVADMRAFDAIVEIDEEAQEVTVQAGIQFPELEAALNEHGLSLRAQPITAPYSTVGGWVATGGGGFGSHQYGTVRDMLVDATVLTPEGTLETLEGAALDLVEGCQGTTGFIIEVTLRVREQTELVPTAAAFDGMAQVQAYLNRVEGTTAHSVHVLSPEHIELKQEATGGRNLPRKKHLVTVAFEAPHAEEGARRLQEACEAIGGDWDETAAAFDWEHRHNFLNFRQFGPSLALGHAVVHRSKLSKAWKAGLEAVKAPEWGLWAVAVSPDEFLLQAAILADERIPNHPLAFGNALAFEDAVHKAGGRPYTCGLLGAANAKQVLGKDRYKRVASWKKDHDKQEIMNPGKVVPARLKGMPMLRVDTAMGPGMAMWKSMRGSFDHRRGSGPDTSNRALWTSAGRRLSPRLADLTDELYKCSGMGMTNRVADLHLGIEYEGKRPRKIVRAHRFDTQLPRGIVAAAQAILEGHVPGQDVASHALTLPAVPTYEQASQNGLPILPIIEGVREAGQHDGLVERVYQLVHTLEQTGNVLGKDAESRGDWLPGGTPAGVDTTTLLVAGDVGAYERTDDAAAAFSVLMGTGFGFTTLGASEVHPGTVPYRLGAFDAAAATCQAFAEAAERHLKDRAPAALLCLSHEDADVLRRRLTDLLEASDFDWNPDVITLPQALAAMVADGRLQFQGDEASDEQAPDAEQSEDDEDTAEDEQAEADAPDEEEAADEDDALEEEAATDEDDAGPEALEVTLLHSPFATDEDRAAMEAVVEAIPGVSATPAPADAFVPDLAFLLTEDDSAKELVADLKERIDGTVLVGCTDLAHVLKSARVDVVTLQEVVAQRMVAREGGGAALEVTAGEQEEGFKEFDIPEGAFRVELVKQEAAIPVFPDQNILDVAEEFGFEDLPYDCRAGSCVTCSARWEGTAPDQSEGQSLSEEEQETHVLTCIAKPKGEVKIWTGEQP